MKTTILASIALSLLAVGCSTENSSVSAVASAKVAKPAIVCSESNPSTHASTTFSITQTAGSGAVKHGAGKLVTQGGIAKFIAISNYACHSANFASKLAVFPTLWTCTQLPVIPSDTAADLATVTIDLDRSAAKVAYDANVAYPNGVTRALSCN